MNKIHILYVGIENAARVMLKECLATCEINDVKYDLDVLMDLGEPIPSAVLCGPPPAELSLLEIAQMLSMKYKGVPVFFVSFSRHGYDRRIFMKNGFTDAFILPLDIDFLKRELNAVKLRKGTVEAKAYKSVKVADIDHDTVLEFDTSVYLPANNRYLKYSSAGDKLDKDRVEKLKQKIGTLHIPEDQLAKFKQYTAERTKASGKPSETEKKDKIETMLRSLMSGIFNDSLKEATYEHAQGLLVEAKEIATYFVSDPPTTDWYRHFLKVVGEMTANYGHVANVSMYAGLFSIGLAVCDPIDLAMAGLFHDIGLSDVPQDTVLRKEDDRSIDEHAIYHKHPEFSINILKRRKILLPEKVQRAIMQHHERHDGTGYPQKLSGPRISKEAQLLALADRFDYIASEDIGGKLRTPEESVAAFKTQVLQDTAKMIFDPELLKLVLKLFP